MIAEEQQTENGVGMATFPLTNFMHCKPTQPGWLEDHVKVSPLSVIEAHVSH